MSGAIVKERTGIGESSLSEFENDKREPSLSQLQKLAELYQRSVSFFLDSGPIASEPVVVWRMRPERDAESIEVKFLRLCEQYHNLETWTGEHAAVLLPIASQSRNQFRYGDAEELAKLVRRDLQLGDRPAQCLLPVLEEACGVKVFHLEFEPSGTAASALSQTFGAAILLNAKNARWRRNYDLAHELFHLLTWKAFHPGGDTSCDPYEEKLANCFAADLLMPTEPFRTAIHSRICDGKISFASLFDVAREFDVSIDSVMWRMHFLYRDKSKSEQTKQEIEQAKHQAPMLEERDSPKPHEWPERYRSLAIKALHRGELAIGRFAEYLNISRQEAMRFVAQEVSDGEEVQVALT
jgi:Zn-dependent peptidase ImmA (M78 family)